MFRKQVKGVFLAEVVQLCESKHLGTPLILGGFINCSTVFKSSRLMLVMRFYKFDHLFEGEGIGF